MTMEAKELLKTTVEKLEKLNEEKAKIEGYIKETLDEAGSQGLNKPLIKKALKFKSDPDKYTAEMVELNTYLDPFQLSFF